MMTKLYNIYVEKNTSFSLVLNINTALDLSDYSFTCNIGKYDVRKATFKTFTLIDANNVNFSITPKELSNIESDKYQYEIVMKSGDLVYKLLKGLFYLEQTIKSGCHG